MYMPKFKPARIIPKLFTGVPFSGANYDLSTFSANTIAPYEIGLNTSGETIVVNFGGHVVEFYPTGSTTVTGDYVPRSGSTMFGSLNMTGGTSVQWTNTGFTGSLIASAQTATRLWELPDKSGTLALTPRSRVISGSYTVTTDYQIYFVDTSGGVCKPDLPASPAVGDTYWFYDQRSDFATLGVELNGNGHNINGSTPLILSANNQHCHVIYNGSQWSAFISA